jgi:hypothetical protein
MHSVTLSIVIHTVMSDASAYTSIHTTSALEQICYLITQLSYLVFGVCFSPAPRQEAAQALPEAVMAQQ